MGAGKKPLGFLNNFVYSVPHCFADITSGANLFGAVKGWDPASGLGTPVFSCLLDEAMQRP
jgi:tripeptidyl-peptidase-1